MISISKRLGRIFSGAKADVVFIANTSVKDANFTYLTCFTGGSFEGSIIVASRRGATLLTSLLEYQIARKQRPKEMKVICVKSRDELLREVARLLKGKRVGINGSFLPYNSYKRIRKIAKADSMVDVSDALSSARQVKDWREIETIGIANNIVKKVFSGIERHFKEGMTERQLAAIFDRLMEDYGASSLSFDTIVCFGMNAAVPHHAPGSTRLSSNSFVLIDAGARYMNYCSDVTRTFIFKPDRKSSGYRRMAQMHDTVKEAQKAAFDSIKAGVYADEIHKKAADYINSAYNGIYKGRFIHSLGHSVGIDVHDGPGFSPNEHYRLKAGMVISNEPGIYVEGFGGVRIEDDILVTEKGATIL